MGIAQAAPNWTGKNRNAFAGILIARPSYRIEVNLSTSPNSEIHSHLKFFCESFSSKIYGVLYVEITSMLNGRVRKILKILTAEELAIVFINSNIEKLLVKMIFARIKKFDIRYIHCI